MKTGYKTNQRIRISRRLVGKARLPMERAGEVGLERRGEWKCLKLQPGQCRVSGELELVADAQRLLKGPEAQAGTGQSPPAHPGDAMQAMPRHEDVGDASANPVTPKGLPPESKSDT